MNSSTSLWYIEDWAPLVHFYTIIAPHPPLSLTAASPSSAASPLLVSNSPGSTAPPFLAGLHSLNLTFHSDHIYILFSDWHAMLTTSSALECLILQDSSPSTATPSWATYIHLDTLCELHLINLNPLYACALLHTLHAPALHHLHLKLFNQDFTPLTELLTAPPSPPSPGMLINPTCPYISHLHN
ncbi:hypothetical protein AcV5_002220 [Taiwanofungus camphoratus]|nr:hypothetical protein AcV5_002220 [Antrodia cinnamomea]